MGTPKLPLVPILAFLRSPCELEREREREMAAEDVIFQQDPFIYGFEEYRYNIGGGYDLGVFEEEKAKADVNGEEGFNNSNVYWESLSQTTISSSSSPETCGGLLRAKRKRRRTKPMKNKEEMENQRMTHIAVERNRRRQMNDYLAVLRSLMPPSYSQRGDQASIVGGAINFVKELEQLHQFLEANNPIPGNEKATPFSNFFTFPQYSTFPSNNMSGLGETGRSSIADIEVMMVESHANIKLSTKKRPRQLLKLVAGFHSIALTILHLNITTLHHLVLYSFSVKVEDECELSTVNDIAATIHNIVGMIEEESICS